MDLRLKRLVRTPHSEQYALFDFDRTDENYDPLSIGKLDLHFTEQGIYGTFLLWKEPARNMALEEARTLVEGVLAEFVTPMGIPGDYAVEFFSPEVASYHLFSNMVTGEAAEE